MTRPAVSGSAAVAPHPYSLDAPRPILLAHRGGGLEAPENSDAAIAHLEALGIIDMETDAHLTVDGVVVLTHDPTLERTTDGTGEVADHTWDALARLRSADGARMIRLDALLRERPWLRLNVDAKVSGVVAPLVAVIDDARAWERVCLASFSSVRLRRAARIARRRGARAATSLGGLDVAGLLLASWLPRPAGDLVRRLLPGPQCTAGVRTHGAVCVQVPQAYGPLSIVTPRFVATAHRHGLAVHVWTVDDPAQARRLLELGVDGLISDRPSVLAPLVAAAPSR